MRAHRRASDCGGATIAIDKQNNCPNTFECNANCLSMMMENKYKLQRRVVLGLVANQASIRDIKMNMLIFSNRKTESKNNQPETKRHLVVEILCHFDDLNNIRCSRMVSNENKRLDYRNE